MLDDLGARAVADGSSGLLQGFDAAHVDTHRGVELQRLAAGGCLGGSKEDADLLAQLVDEDRGRSRRRQRARDLTQRLAHEASLESHVGVTHLPLDLCLRNERGDGVDDDDIDAA